MNQRAQIRLCTVCGRVSPRFRPGPGGRPDAGCTTCQSLERHRFLALLLDSLAGSIPTSGHVLDVAPTKCITPRLRAMGGPRYLAIDFDPAADGRPVNVQASLTDLPLADRSVAFMVCYHVLEHIPDDRRAMREIARVLADGGMAVLQVPWRPEALTDEDPSASAEERTRRFGQADHVRYYGREFPARLEESGLRLTCIRPTQILPAEFVELTRLRDEAVWIATAADTSTSGDASVVDLTRVLATLLTGQLRSVAGTAISQEELRKAQAEAQRWHRRYDALRGRLPVRLMAGAADTGKGLRNQARGAINKIRR